MSDLETPSTTDVSAHASGILSSTRIMMIRRIVMTVGAAGTTAVIARQLDLHDFGTYSVALATFYLAQAGCDLGFAQVLVREMAQRPADRSFLTKAALSLSLIWSVAVAAGLFIYAVLFNASTAQSALIVLVPAVASTGLSVTRQWFIVDYKVAWLARLDLSLNVCQFAASIAIVLLGGGPVLLAGAISVAAIINAVLVAVNVLARVRRVSVPPRTRRSILKMAIPIGIPSILVSAYFSIDLLIAAAIVPGQDVAYYAAAVKIMSMLMVIPGTFMSMALPGFSALGAEQSRDSLSELVARIWHWLTAFGLTGCLGIFLYVDLVVDLLFGSSYAGAAVLVRILMCATAASFASYVLSTLLVSQGLGSRMLLQNVIALVATVALNVWLLPIHGIQVAAFVTLGGEVFLAITSAMWLRNRICWRPILRVGIRPLIAMASLVFLYMVGPRNDWANVALAIVVFIFLMSATRAWPFDDGRIVRHFRRRHA